MSNRKPAPLALTSLSIVMILCSGCLGSSETKLSPDEKRSETRVEVEKTSEQEKKESTPLVRRDPKRNENALAIEQHEVDGVEVALMRVKRSSGNTVNVYWTYTNNSPEEKNLTPNGISSWYTPYQLAADSYIIDNSNQKKHLVVKAKGNPIVSKLRLGSETPLPPGASLNVWAKFPAPPADVETISVYIRGIPPIEDVQITE